MHDASDFYYTMTCDYLVAIWDWIRQWVNDYLLWVSTTHLSLRVQAYLGLLVRIAKLKTHPWVKTQDRVLILTLMASVILTSETWTSRYTRMGSRVPELYSTSALYSILRGMLRNHDHRTKLDWLSFERGRDEIFFRCTHPSTHTGFSLLLPIYLDLVLVLLSWWLCHPDRTSNEKACLSCFNLNSKQKKDHPKSIDIQFWSLLLLSLDRIGQ